MASVLEDNMVRVKMSELKLYPKNPRKGNIDAVAESLKENGQFRPLVVQKSTNYILGGNHTYRAAQKLKWKTIQVVYVDVDDERAKKIVLADNRTSDLASYDSEILSEILSSLETPDVGTGYDTADVQSILAAVVDRDTDLINEVINDKPRIEFNSDDDDDLDFGERLSRQQEALQNSPVVDDEAIQNALRGEADHFEAPTGKERIHAEIQAAVEPLLDRVFSSSNYWGIPDLLPDMIPDSFPEPIDTWAGMDTTPDDGKTHWFFNWGTAPSKGFPWERGIVAFYTSDVKWEGWYINTAHIIGKVMSNGLKMAVAPDNSVVLGLPRYTHLRANFEGAWLARVMQEAGIKVIPNLKFTDPESMKYAVLGIPKKTPVLMYGCQSMSEEHMEELSIHTTLRAAVKEIQPEQLIVYGGPPAERMLERAKLPKSVDARYVENFSAKKNKALIPWREERKKHDKAVKEARKRRDEKNASADEEAGSVEDE